MLECTEGGLGSSCRRHVREVTRNTDALPRAPGRPPQAPCCAKEGLELPVAAASLRAPQLATTPEEVCVPVRVGEFYCCTCVVTVGHGWIPRYLAAFELRAGWIVLTQ